MLAFMALAVSAYVTACDDDDGVGEPVLNGVELIRADQIPVLPRTIAVLDEAIFVGGDGDTLLRAFNRRTGSQVAALGRKGSGPGEFRTIASLQAINTSHHNNELWAFDWTLGRLSGYRVVGGAGIVAIDSILSGFKSNNIVAWIGDSTLVGFPTNSRNRFSVLDRRGQIKQPVGTAPLVSDGVPPRVAHQIMEPSVIVHPTGQMIAIGAMHAGQIDIYSLKTGTFKAADVPVPFPPVISMYFNGAIWVHKMTGQTLYGYIALAGTHEKIYALFSGRTMSGCQRCAWFGNQLHVFDWDGHLLAVRTLDTDAIAIAVTEDGSQLYSLSQEPEPTVRAYTLLPSPAKAGGREIH